MTEEQKALDSLLRGIISQIECVPDLSPLGFKMLDTRYRYWLQQVEPLSIKPQGFHGTCISPRHYPDSSYCSDCQ